MSALLVIAACAITLALIFYTIGVFAERRAGTLKKSHVLFFYLGLIFDTTGTITMSFIAQTGATSIAHALTGAFAIVLMIIHAIWATVVFIKQNQKSLRNFHALSIGVWLIWLIPYVCGMLMGIPAIALDSNLALLIAVIVSLTMTVLVGRDSILIIKSKMQGMHNMQHD